MKGYFVSQFADFHPAEVTDSDAVVALTLGLVAAEIDIAVVLAVDADAMLREVFWSAACEAAFVKGFLHTVDNLGVGAYHHLSAPFAIGASHRVLSTPSPPAASGCFQ